MIFEKQLSHDQICKILHVTICNIESDKIEVSRIAIKALSRTIPSTAQNFLVQEQRDFIMKGIFTAIEIGDE